MHPRCRAADTSRETSFSCCHDFTLPTETAFVGWFERRGALDPFVAWIGAVNSEGWQT